MLNKIPIYSNLNREINRYEGKQGTATDNVLLQEKTAKELAYERDRPNINGLGGMVSDMSYSIGNMAPSIATGFVNPGLGLAAVGAGAGGGAYAEAIEKGKTENQALAYGTMTGVLEAFMQKALGGIKIFGKTGVSKVIGKQVDDVVKSVVKNPAAQKVLGEAMGMGSEFLDEYLQAVAAPVVANITLDEKNEINPFEKEKLYQGLMGALTAGVFNATTGAINYAVNRQQANAPQTNTKPPAPISQAQTAQDINSNILPNQEEANTPPKILEQQREENRETFTPIEEQDKGIQRGEAVWQNKDVDQPIIVTGYAGNMNGVDYVNVEGSNSAIPVNEIVYNNKKTTQVPNANATSYTSETEPVNTTAQATIDSGIKNNVSEGTIRKISELAEKMGVNVVFENGMVGNGKYQDGTIYINKNSKTPIKDTFIHELTHHIENSGKYNEFANSVMDSDFFHTTLQAGGMTLHEYKQSIYDTYAQNGIELDDMGVNKEIVAKFAEKYLSDEKTIERLAQTDKSLFQTIKQWINDMLVRFKGTTEEKSLLKMQQLYDKALKSVGNGGGKSERFSVSTDADGKQYVVIDEDILSGVPKSEWVKTVKNVLKTKFAKGIDINGKNIGVNLTSRDEFTNSKYSQTLRTSDNQKYSDKYK
ncbi:MAG: hypothetical protein RR263_00615, partial [Oscillospiraceae bacterium]